MNDKHINRVEAYFKKTLSEKEEKQFMNDVRSDKALRRTFEEYQLAVDATDEQVERDLRLKFAGWRDAQNKNRRRSLIIYTGIAASILLLIGIYLISNRGFKINGNIQLALKLYELPDTPESTMGNEDRHWSLGREAFGQQKFVQAIDEWKKIEEPGPEVNYYLAHCYFNIENYNNAISLFQELSSGTSVYSYSSDWYLALAYLAADQPDRVHDQLMKIVNDTTHPYHDDARDLKIKMKE